MYQQPDLTIEESIDVAAKGLADTIICPMLNARFNITQSGVDVAFDFVRRAQTFVNICIDGRSHKADALPFPLNGSRVFYMRYSADAFLVDWCPAQSQVLVPLELNGENYHDMGNTFFDLVDDQNNPAIARMHSSQNNHRFTAEFQPPFIHLSLKSPISMIKLLIVAN